MGNAGEALTLSFLLSLFTYIMLRLKGAALFRASTLMAGIGFLLFGYDQVRYIGQLSIPASHAGPDRRLNLGCHVWCYIQ